MSIPLKGKPAQSPLTRAIAWLISACCLLCDDRQEWQHGLCEGCWASLPRNNTPCRICALPLTGGNLCGSCQTCRRTFDKITAPVIYHKPIDQMVCDLKYRKRLPWARTAAGLIVEAIHEQDDVLPEVLIPVPMTVRALRPRGFNQSAYIARLVGRQLKIKTRGSVVVKRHETERQSTLSHRARQTNLAGAFEVQKQLTGQRIAIIDDVITTGSTARELAKVLKIAGAGAVVAWAFARTPAGD